MNNNIIAYKLYADGRRELITIENELSALQEQVGGYIEPFSLLDDPRIESLANEEGIIKGLPVNKHLPHIHGDVLFVGVNGDEFCSLTDEQVYCLYAIFDEEIRKAIEENIEQEKGDT